MIEILFLSMVSLIGTGIIYAVIRNAIEYQLDENGLLKHKVIYELLQNDKGYYVKYYFKNLPILSTRSIYYKTEEEAKEKLEELVESRKKAIEYSKPKLIHRFSMDTKKKLENKI